MRFGVIWIIVLSWATLGTGTAQIQPYTGECILVIGDSIPAGHAVTQVPGYGYPVVKSPPFSHILDAYFSELDLTHIGIYNLSVGASSLGSDGDVSYIASNQYEIALNRSCRFAVIFPWINDLPDTADSDLGQAHIERLGQLAGEIQGASPGTHVIMIDYYRVVGTELGQRVYGSRISAPVIGMMNTLIGAACEPGGAFAAGGNVSCLHIEPLLFPLDDVLMNTLTEPEAIEQGIRALNSSEQHWFDAYWLANPGGVIAVDGVHLNPEGKQRFATALHLHMQRIDPAMFQVVGG